MATVKEMIVKLGVDADSKAVSQFGKGLEQVRSNALALTRAVGTAASGAAALGGALIANAKQAATGAENILKRADALGVTTDKFQQLRFAVSRFTDDAGKDTQDLLSVLTDRAEDAARGTTSFVEAFSLIGVETENIDKLSPEEILMRTAEGFRQTEDSVKRLTAAERLLGGDLGQKLLPLLQQGRAGLQGFGQQAKDLGIIFERDALEGSKRFGRALDNLWFIGDKFRKLLAHEMSPALNDIVDQLIAWTQANQEVIRQRIGKVAEDLVDAFYDVRDALVAADEVVQEKFGGWVPMLRRLISLSKTFAAIWATTKVAGIAGGFGNLISGLMQGIAGTSLGAALGGWIKAGLAKMLAPFSSMLWGATYSNIVGGITSALSTAGAAIASWATTAASYFATVVLPLTVTIGILYDIVALARGDDTITGWILDWLASFEMLEGVVAGFRSGYDSLTTWIGESTFEAVQAIREAWADLGDWLDEKLTQLEASFFAMGRGIERAFFGFFRAIERRFSGFVDSTWGWIESAGAQVGLDLSLDDGGRRQAAAAGRGAQRRQPASNTSVSVGDTVFQIEESSDPQAVADEVQRRQQRREERVLRKAREQAIYGGEA